MLPQWGKRRKGRHECTAMQGSTLGVGQSGSGWGFPHGEQDNFLWLFSWLTWPHQSPAWIPRSLFFPIMRSTVFFPFSHTHPLLPFNLVSAFFIIKRCILFKLRTRSTELLPFSYILPFHSQFVSLKVFISSNTDNVKMSWHCYYCV